MANAARTGSAARDPCQLPSCAPPWHPGLPSQTRASLELLERLGKAGSQRIPAGPHGLLTGPSLAATSSSAKQAQLNLLCSSMLMLIGGGFLGC